MRTEEDGEEEERTFFFLPVGAGAELTGPGGDGFVSVVTPASEIGRTLMGARPGDVFDAEIAGALREWTVLELS